MTLSLVYLMVGAIAFKLVRRFVLIVRAFYLFCKSEYFEKYRIYRCAYADEQIKTEIRSNFWILPFDLAIVAFVHYYGWIKLGPNTLLMMATSFWLMFVWYEIWFYAIHRVMHMKRFYFLHAPHHRARVTNPWTAHSFTFAERFILNVGAMGFAIVVSHFIPISLTGFAIYFLVNNFLSIMSHANTEVVPIWFTKTWLGRIFFTPSFHAMHHSRFRGHYGLFTQVPDRIFNTVWPDYELVHERAITGIGLTSVNQRLSPQAAPTEVVHTDATQVA